MELEQSQEQGLQQSQEQGLQQTQENEKAKNKNTFQRDPIDSVLPTPLPLRSQHLHRQEKENVLFEGGQIFLSPQATKMWTEASWDYKEAPSFCVVVQENYSYICSIYEAFLLMEGVADPEDEEHYGAKTIYYLSPQGTLSSFYKNPRFSIDELAPNHALLLRFFMGAGPSFTEEEAATFKAYMKAKEEEWQQASVFFQFLRGFISRSSSSFSYIDLSIEALRKDDFKINSKLFLETDSPLKSLRKFTKQYRASDERLKKWIQKYFPEEKSPTYIIKNKDHYSNIGGVGGDALIFTLKKLSKEKEAEALEEEVRNDPYTKFPELFSYLKNGLAKLGTPIEIQKAN
jgi:hypothetical protein